MKSSDIEGVSVSSKVPNLYRFILQMRVEQLLRLSLSLLTQGNLNQALETCLSVLSQSPNCAEAYRILGNIQEARQQFTEAASAYIKAIELQPNLTVAYVFLAQLYRNVGWIDDAVLLYQTVVAIRPDWAELHYYLGDALYRQGNLLESIAAYQQAIIQNPRYTLAYLGLAVTLNTQNQPEQAIDILQQAIAICPDAAAYNALGCLLLEQNQIDEAFQLLQQAITLRPDWSIPQNNLAQVLLKQSKIGEAITAYKRAIELQPDLAVAYLNLGKVWQQQNDHVSAVQYFQNVIELMPNNIIAYSDCGYSLQMQGKLNQALAYFQTAISLEPKFVEAYCRRFESLSIAEAESDNLLQAQIACSQFLRVLQQSNFNLNNLIDSSESQHQSENYQSSSFQSKKLYDYLTQVYMNLGKSLTRYGKFEQAIKYYHSALQVQPINLEIYALVAYCFIQDKQWNQAITVCHIAQTIAIKNQQSVPEFDLLFGYIFEKTHHWERAIESYSKVWKNCDESTQFTSSIIEWLSQSESQNLPQAQLPINVYHSTFNWLKSQGLEQIHYTSINFSRNKNFKELAKKSLDNESEITCAGLECGQCLNHIFKQFELKNIGDGVQTCSRSEKILVPSFETFVATIPNGRTWIVPQENHWMVCKAIAIITPDGQLLADVSREYPGQLPGCPVDHSTQHQIFKQEQLPPLKLIQGSVAVLSGLSGHIYFHWMVDVLPRIELLRRSGINLNKIDYFLVNSYQLPFQQETLNQLGISSSKIIESDQIPHLQAEHLIVPSFAGHLGWLQPWAIDFLRQTFLPLSNQNTANYPERIYISRAKAKHRQVLNETEVMQVLNPYGFVKIELETLSFSQQVTLFARAKVIIAPHGSGLTNILFCSIEVIVIELVSPHYNRHYYWVISQYLGFEHYSLPGDGFICYPIRQLMYQNPLTEDIWVNLANLKKFIGKIGLRNQVIIGQ